MKKVFLTLAMLLIAFTGVMRAQETLTVHDGTTTNGYVPVYGYYADSYLKAEMVYPAEDLSVMASEPIRSITFYASQSAVAWGCNFQVSVAEVDATTLSDFAGPGTLVYEGTLAIANGEMKIKFDTPYEYQGGNLLVCVYSTTTGTYLSSTWYGEEVTGAAVSGYSYTSLDAVTATVRNFLPKATFGYGELTASIEVSPTELDLGNRPIGAWMAPATITISNLGSPIAVTEITSDNNFFSSNTEVPFTMDTDEVAEIEIATGGSVTPGDLESNVVIMYTADRNVSVVPVTATAYEPVDGDVWEKAIEVTSFPYQGNAPSDIYHNYEIGGNEDAFDAVYEVTFDEPVMFNAGTNGADAKTRLYNQDFEEVGGPAADNYYEYNGPEVNPGPTNLWFSYDYTGSNTFYGSSAGGGMYFGYRIPAETLQDLELGDCSIMTVESAARQAYPYDLFLLQGDDVATADLLYYQPMNFTPEALYYFSLDLDEPVMAGDSEDLWVIMYSESPYAAYCGKYPTDTNGKIYYTLNGETWYSNSNYTPMIYVQFLELPTGREVTVGPSGVTILPIKGQGNVDEVVAEVKGVSKAQRYAEAKAQTTNNRDAIEVLNEGFESGSMPSGWSQTSSYWQVTSGTGHSSMTGSATGNYNAGCYMSSYSGSDMLITPEMDMGTFESAALTFNFWNTSWGSDINTLNVYYRVDGGDWTSLYTDNAANDGYTSVEIELTGIADNYQIGFECVSAYSYGMAIDDVMVIAQGDPVPMYQISDMYVPAGTYYVAVASTDDNFQVDMYTEEAPLPYQSFVLSPYNGETGVESPYYAEWILGDYTEEMQVLLGTVYPPTTVLLDWTDELVESMFLADLDHNKTYFIQVNERNAAGTVEGDIIGFTTVIDPVEGFTAEATNLYPGDAAVFTWEANRSHKGYNLYMNDTLVNAERITETTYTVEGLEYNTEDGYKFQVSAIYDEGESALSDPIYVYMTGTGNINGYVYEIDSLTPVYNVAVELRGVDEYGVEQTIAVGTTNPSGYYEGEALAGTYMAYGVKEGYQDTPSEEFVLANDSLVENANIYMLEDWAALGSITATEQEEDVLVEWSWDPASMIVDFETGDFSQAEFTLPASYPWAITTSNVYEGTYAMKSTCEGIASGVSSIEATVEVPYAAKMGFYLKLSTEQNWDKFYFYIDGVAQGQPLSGASEYTYKEFTVDAGTHTYKWEYVKDGSVNSNDDCVYVDNITMYRQDIPLPPTPGAQTFSFDADLEGWTLIDNDGDGHNWYHSTDAGSHGTSAVTSHSGAGHVMGESYCNATYAVLTPDDYMIAPTQIDAEDGASISFWACAQDVSYASEHFGVAVSTTGNTSAADFTTIQEWTLTAKKGFGDAEVHGLVRGGKEGTWYQYTADLSSYAGQTIWVAIRHFNCTDMFLMCLDDVVINDGSAKGFELNRTLANYKLYRRDNYRDSIVELIAEPAADVMDYTDTDWADLEFGIYQWGIQAIYEGNHNYPEIARDEVVIGSGTTTDTHLPAYNLFNYSLTEQIYTAEEIGTAGTINSFSVYCEGSVTRTLDVYMLNTTEESFASATSWIVPTASDLVYSGSVTMTAGDWTTITLDTPFEYDGTSNLVIIVDDNTGTWTSSVNYRVFSATSQAIYVYSDGTNYDPTSPSGNTGTVATVKNQIKLDIASSGTTGGVIAEGFGCSDVLWSNEIEKDMEADLTFNLTLNNNQSPAGAVITLTGVEDLDGTVEETSYVFEGIRKGEYIYTVELEGYDVVSDTIEFIADEVIDILLIEQLLPVADLYVSPTGWAKWTGSAVTGGGGGGSASTFTEGFESGMPEGWTIIDANSDGTTWTMTSDIPTTWTYYASLTLDWYRTGTNAICSGSYVNGLGALNPDEYLVTPQVTLVNGSTFSFWAAATDASYAADHFGVFVSDNGTSDWTMVNEWTLTAKSDGLNGGLASRNGNGAKLGSWYNYSVDLSAYAGQKYIAIRHFNCTDQYIMCVDDIELSDGSKGTRAALAYKIELEGLYEGDSYNNFWQHNVDNLNEGDTLVTRVAAVYATGMSEWAEYEWVYAACDNYEGATDVTATENEPGTAVELSWTMPEGGQPTPPTPGTGQWYQYDDNTPATGVGAGGPFWWAVMFPAGSYTGDMVTKVATYGTHDDLYGTNGAFTGTVTIYNDGTTAPATAVGTMNITMPDTNELVEFEFSDPVAIDDSKNLWIVFYNASSSDYVASASIDCGDANARWVSVDGTSWMDLANAGLSGYSWMLRAYVAEGAKGEVHEITVPTQTAQNAGELSMTPLNRDMWDYVTSFSGSSAGQQAVATDGDYIYTASWQASPTGGYTFYKYELDGTFVEGFNITGATGIRDLTTDGEYFYGSSGSAQIFCLDLANKTLVSTINCSGLTSRHLSYDPERDGFWSGNWATLALYDRTGALVQTAAAPTSAYGSAYYKDADGVEHLFLFCQPNSDAKVYDYNIGTNTISSSPVLDFASTPNFNAGIAGGCFIGTYDNKTCWFGNAQQDPNLVGIYELDANSTPPTPPTPQGNILGALVYRDGELLTPEPISETTYVDEAMEIGEHEYCIRVVYDDWSMSCMECAEVNYTGVVENDVVDNLYPNPTRGNVTIEAQGMNHITVVSALGQVVYDADVDADMINLNLGNYKAGIYMVRVNTENGVSVKRVTVVR